MYASMRVYTYIYIYTYIHRHVLMYMSMCMLQFFSGAVCIYWDRGAYKVTVCMTVQV